MKKSVVFLILVSIFTTNIFAEKICLNQNEKIELDSLLSVGDLSKLKKLIDSKHILKIDTFYLNHQIDFFSKNKLKIDLLKNTISQFDNLDSKIQTIKVESFKKYQSLFEEKSLDKRISSLYKKCIASDSLEYCFISQYYLQKHNDYKKDITSIDDSIKSGYIDKCLNLLDKFDNNLTRQNINICIRKIDSLITNKKRIILNIRETHKCLTNNLMKYKNILEEIEIFNNYRDSVKIEIFNRLKSKEILYSTLNAGELANNQFNNFKNSNPFVSFSIYNYLLAKKLKSEYIQEQKHLIRNQLKNVIDLQSKKYYDEALNNLEKYRQKLPTIQVYKYFSDSLRYEYDKLEVEIRDQRYNDSFWISQEKLNKKYQILIGTGIQYNPPLMKLNWHFLSSVNSNSYKMPIYKLRESVGIQYNLEFDYHVTSELLAGIHLNHGIMYITKAILSDSREISKYNKQDTERIISYTINSIGSNIFGKYYLRISPGLMPYLKLALGGLTFWRKSIRLKNLFNIKNIDNEEKYLYLIEKNAQEVYISPEFGIDLLKNAESKWILSVYFHTIFMSGGMNQMLGHFRGCAGIKFGMYK